MLTVPALTFCPYTAKHNNLGFKALILFILSLSFKFSAQVSSMSTLYPIDLHDSASKRDQVGGSIAEYLLDSS